MFLAEYFTKVVDICEMYNYYTLLFQNRQKLKQAILLEYWILGKKSPTYMVIVGDYNQFNGFESEQ